MSEKVKPPSKGKARLKAVTVRLMDQGAVVVERIVAPNPETSHISSFEGAIRARLEKSIGREDTQKPTKGVTLRNNLWHTVMRGPVRIAAPEIAGGKENRPVFDTVRELQKQKKRIAYVGNHRAHFDTDTTEEALRREGY